MDGKKCQCEPGFRGKFCQISIGQGICQKLAPCVFNQLDLDSSKNEDWMTECHNNTNINGLQMFGNSFRISAKGPKSGMYLLIFTYFLIYLNVIFPISSAACE